MQLQRRKKLSKRDSKRERDSKRGGGLSEFGSSVYEETASVGRFVGLASLVIGLVLSTILIIVGVYLLVRKQKYSASVTARVLSAQCVSVVQGGQGQVQCLLDIEYERAAGEVYRASSVSVSSGTAYRQGSTIGVRYDPGNPMDVTTTGSPRMIGWICLGAGVLLGVGSGVTWYSVNYKPLAAAYGARTIWDMMFGFRG
jgi:hypothetical protein